MTTSLLPRLPRSSRPAFGIGLLIVVALLVVFVMLRWQPPLIGISALGLPLLFAVYLAETDSLRGVPRSTWVGTAALGTGLGVAWAAVTDAIWARTYDDVLATPMSTLQAVINLAAVPIGGAVVMLLPVFAARLRRVGTREPLHGFAIGALGATCFTAAQTLTQAAPEFAKGLVMAEFPTDALVALAAIRGVAGPLTAIALGGIVGVALWFRPRTGAHRHWYVPTAVVLVMLACVGQNAVDFAWISYGRIEALYAAITVIALIASGITVRRALLDEDHPGGADGTSRAGSVRHTSPARLLMILGPVLAVVLVSTIALSSWLTPPPARYVCPPDCGRPPIGRPVATNPRFMPADGGFAVSYPGPATAYEATPQAAGVVLKLRAGDGGTLRLFGEPAANRTPRQITDDFIAANFPDATTDYEVPNAIVGYQLGYGVVADVFKAGAAGDTARLRVLVMVAVKHDLALVAAAAGPYREFTPDFGSGHPSGANFFLALDMSKYVNSFRWRGDPPR